MAECRTDHRHRGGKTQDIQAIGQHLTGLLHTVQLVARLSHNHGSAAGTHRTPPMHRFSLLQQRRTQAFGFKHLALQQAHRSHGQLPHQRHLVIAAQAACLGLAEQAAGLGMLSAQGQTVKGQADPHLLLKRHLQHPALQRLQQGHAATVVIVVHGQ
ncbi:hypothetical protein D3C76_1023080 [compost metagenome]